MAQNTAMQTLIEQLKSQNNEYYEKWKAAKGKDKKTWNDGMTVLTLTIIRAESLLPKERQDIEAAVNEGMCGTMDAKEYFNKTFTQNK
jgi:hypothetical protein